MANGFESATYTLGGYVFDRYTIPSTSEYITGLAKNTLTNRAGSSICIPVTNGRIIANSGYEVNIGWLTGSTTKIDSNSKTVFVDLLYGDYDADIGKYTWATEKNIDSGTRYCVISIKKTNNTDFTQNELNSLYGTAFYYEGDPEPEPETKYRPTSYDYEGNEVLLQTGYADTVVISASNSSDYDKRISDFVCTGQNDEVVIQNAIDSFGDNSGVIQLCDGTYNIDSFTAHDGYYYGLYLPKKKREIIIRGVNHNHKTNNTSWNAIDKAAIINVTSSAYSALSNSQESYVIGSNRAFEFPYKTLGIEDLTISLPNNTKPVIGIDGGYLADLHVYRTFMRTGGDYTCQVPPNPKCIAIRGCPGGNIGYNYTFEHIKIIGWGTGLHFAGEAATITDVQVQRAVYGFVLGNITELTSFTNFVGIHPSVMIDCGGSYCTEAMLVVGSGYNTMSIIGFNSETGGDSSAVPGQTIWKANDIFRYAGDGSYRGDVSYALVDTETWLPVAKNIWGTDRNADKYFISTDLIAKRIGTTAERPADPCFMSKYYDTTIGKFLMFNGTSWVELT